MHQKIAQLHNCTIPIFYSGQHLDKHILGEYTFFNILSSIVKKIVFVTETHISGLQNCNISVTKKMTPLIGEQFDCSNSIPCTQTHHEVASTRYHFNPNENPKFRIEYARNETEIYQYSKKVSTQGLIGQVGGINGITLGWSIWNPYFERTVELLNTIMHICN